MCNSEKLRLKELMQEIGSANKCVLCQERFIVNDDWINIPKSCHNAEVFGRNIRFNDGQTHFARNRISSCMNLNSFLENRVPIAVTDGVVHVDGKKM